MPSQRNDDAPCLSIVSAAFCESGNIAAFVAAVTAALTPDDIDFEIILVDDGSHDQTWSEILTQATSDARVRGLRLSRNFGQQGALMAGMAQAQGAAVVTIDCDLQHPPELIPVLLRHWLRGADLVHSRRERYAVPSLFKQLTATAFYAVFRFFTSIQLSDGYSDFRLLDRKLVDQVLTLAKREPFLRGWLTWIKGHYVVEVPFTARQRFTGRSKYSMKKMLRLAALGLWTFSHSPFRLMVVASAAALLLAALVTAFAPGGSVFTPLAHADAAWRAPTFLALLGLGLMLAGVGVTGEFLGKILQLARHWPTALIDDAVNCTPLYQAKRTPVSTRQNLVGPTLASKKSQTEAQRAS